MSNWTTPSTKEAVAIEVLGRVENAHKELYAKATEYSIVEGLIYEVSVFSIGLSLNGISKILLGVILIPKPLLFIAGVTAGIIGMCGPKIRAHFMRRAAYNEYAKYAGFVEGGLDILKALATPAANAKADQ